MIWLLDNGHGGMVNGVYVTPGKRSPEWPDMPQLFEGVFNRQVVKLIADGLDKLGIQFEILVKEQEDISLSERVARTNALHAKHDGNVALLCVHANAGGGTGWEVWTSVGETKSDSLATYFFTEFSMAFPEFPMRSDYTDGDPDKEAQFYMLRKTICPAVLTENFFMDTRRDCRLILSKEGRVRIANAHINAIRRIEKVKKKLPYRDQPS